MRKGLIDKEGNVVDTVEIEEGANWSPPKGIKLGPEGGEVGGTFKRGKYKDKPLPPPIEDDKLAQEELEVLDKKMTRANEDMINVGIDKGLWKLADFPKKSQEAFFAKRLARQRLKQTRKDLSS